jgi:hypothetical protein
MGDNTDLWDLNADPATVETLEGAWKSQVKQLSWAADTINDTANRVIGGEAWVGETADRFDQHRRKLVGDLDKCAELADKVARSLGECAHVIRHGQGRLTTEKQKISQIRSDSPNGILTFHPADEQEKQLLAEATRAANDIRARVDKELNAHAEVFSSAQQQLAGWQGTWSSRGLRMLNYNIQQGGHGNNPNPLSRQGVDASDLGTLAQRIVDGKVDVATLQEVFKGNVGQLREELNKRAAPGEHFEVYFGKASDKLHWNDGPRLFWPNEDFGNVVVVKTGDGITTGPVSTHTLPNGDEGRSATEVRINVE